MSADQTAHTSQHSQSANVRRDTTFYCNGGPCMTLWTLLMLGVAAGALWWLIDLAPFIASRVKPILQWTFLVVVVFYVLDSLGLFDAVKSIPIG